MLAGALAARAEEPGIGDIDEPPHNYRQRQPQDAFTRRQADFASGKIPLDRSSEKAFLLSLLRALDIPASSQLWVYSTTSLQLSLISPENPRALYFNEELYLGYVPGGRIEIVSFDPEWGGIFYIFDIPRDNQPLSFERSERCMNCHARGDTGDVPGLVVKSVIPGPGGGSLTAYRVGQSGHTIPLDQRFGGWHVTGADGFTNHAGNLTGLLANGALTRLPNPPGKRFSVSRYPVATSDLLPHLVHEHQVGFVNLVVAATYLSRQFVFENPDHLTTDQEVVLERQADRIVRYLLFADEAPFPAGGIPGDPAFVQAFLSRRAQSSSGTSLKDLDLKTRLFRHRCSYMIYTSVFQGLPAGMKQRIYRRLHAALAADSQPSEFAYLGPDERRTLRTILRETLPGLPADW